MTTRRRTFELRSNRKYPFIPTVTDDPQSHTLALRALIEAVAIHERRTKDIDFSFVRVHELVDAGLISIVNNQFNVVDIELGDLADVNLDIDPSEAEDGTILVVSGHEWTFGDHGSIAGLGDDDHPQYTAWAQDESIIGQWQWATSLWGPNGAEGVPSFTFTSDTDTGVFRVGDNNLGIATGGELRWDINSTRSYQDVPAHIEYSTGITDPQDSGVTQYEGMWIFNPDVSFRGGLHFTTLSDKVDPPETDGVGSQIAFWEVENLYGFRIRNTGHKDIIGDLEWWRHNNDATGVLFMRFTRSSSQVQYVAGSAAEPVITTFNDLNTGLYFPAADQIGLSTGGNVRALLTNNFLTLGVLVRAPTGGSNVTPAYSFDGDTDTGMYREVANVLGFSTNQVQRLLIGNTDAVGVNNNNGIRAALSIRGISGSAAVPSFTFATDADNGMYLVGADQVGFAAGGTLRLTITGTGIVSAVGFHAPDGSAAACGFGFTNDTDIGMFRVGTNSVGFATAGTERLRLSADGAWGLAGANYGTVGQVLQSNGSSAAPTWEDQSGGGGGASEFATYLTEDDETSILPNSRRLLAGSGISFDDSVAGERTITNDLGGLNSLATEILADSPLGYWKLDEASGNFADSSGNSRTMTAVGSPSYQYAAIVPRETTRFVYFDATGDRASRTDACGLSMPANADWTVEFIAAIESITTNATLLFAIGGSGETEAANYQILWRAVAGGDLDLFWEHGAGTNLTVPTIYCSVAPLFDPAHYACVKDGTANTITFYKNGRITDVVSYANEPTGGSSVTSEIHGDCAGGTTHPAIIAHVALYNTALSQDRIRAHARSAGFLAV